MKSALFVVGQKIFYGATNIYKIAYNSIHKIGRQSYLCRSNISDTLDNVSKQKIKHSDMGKHC